jgi:hypothetical protein
MLRKNESFKLRPTWAATGVGRIELQSIGMECFRKLIVAQQRPFFAAICGGKCPSFLRVFLFLRVEMGNPSFLKQRQSFLYGILVSSVSKTFSLLCMANAFFMGLFHCTTYNH